MYLARDGGQGQGSSEQDGSSYAEWRRAYRGCLCHAGLGLTLKMSAHTQKPFWALNCQQCMDSAKHGANVFTAQLTLWALGLNPCQQEELSKVISCPLETKSHWELGSKQEPSLWPSLLSFQNQSCSARALELYSSSIDIKSQRVVLLKF